MKHSLRLTWSKAFNEIYCHHATLFIPAEQFSLFSPEHVTVSVTVRKIIILNRKRRHIDRRFSCFMPCISTEDGIKVPLNSTEIVEALSLNTWTRKKDGSRSMLKEFPVNVSYRMDYDREIAFPLARTPFLADEEKFAGMSNGDKLDTEIFLENNS